METTELLERLKQAGKLDEIWLAISLAKINSILHAKTGSNLLEQQAIPPAITREMLDISLHEISELLLAKLQAQN